MALALVLAPVHLHAQDVSALYRARCAVCHGAEGRGDGPAGALLTPPPRDFTSGVYKFRSTPSGTLPTESDVFRTISRGLPGTAMPPFADLLSESAGLVRENERRWRTFHAAVAAIVQRS